MTMWVRTHGSVILCTQADQLHLQNGDDVSETLNCIMRAAAKEDPDGAWSSSACDAFFFFFSIVFLDK